MNTTNVDANLVIQALQQQLADAMLESAIKDAQIVELKRQLAAPPAESEQEQ